jgi:hypothetical protein
VTYQLNPALSRRPDYYLKYGTEISLDPGTPLSDGDAIAFRINVAGFRSPEVTVYYWSRAALDGALRDAGLDQIRWISPELSPEAGAGPDPLQWADYINEPLCVIIDCVKRAGDDGREPDRAEIAGILRTFFAAFTSGPDSAERLDALRQLFLPEAVIIRTCGGEPTVYGVDSFIAPRRELLSGGALTDFREWELSGHTEVFGDIAQHFCGYAKAGVQDGTPFTVRGMKTLQFVRTSAGWRISAAAWDDERDGLAIEVR